MAILWAVNAIVLKWPVHVAEIPAHGAGAENRQLQEASIVNEAGSTEFYEANGKVRNLNLE